MPETVTVQTQYGDLPRVIYTLGDRLEEIDRSHGGSGSAAVGAAVRGLLEMPRGKRPPRVFVDFQHKGMEEIDALTRQKQRAFFSLRASII